METRDKSIRRGIELYIDGKKVKADFKMIQQEVNRLSKEIKTMTIGSEEYNRTADKIRRYNLILRQHRQELRGVQTEQRGVLATARDWMSKWGAMAATAVASITGVALKLNQFRRELAEKEDSAANLKALTGLDDGNIQWLTQQADMLSTTMEKSGLRVRKSATEILEAYMLVGSAKPELLQDKEALNAVTIEAMRLAEAAKMDLKEAVNAVTTSLNQYSAGADQAVRFTNVLAAGSKFGAANVQEQAAAVVKAGVAASSAGVSFEQLVGTIEMLGEKGIKAEEAGTALKRFFLVLQTGSRDTNPAVVGLDKALENLSSKHLSMGELQKMFGDRAINVAKILIDNTEKVRNYTQAVSDTNVATEQAAINSDTTAAKMAQVRNQINLTGQELAKTLAPILSQTVGWTRKFVTAMPAMIDFLKEWGMQLVVLAATYYTLTLRTTVLTKAHALWNATVALSRNLLLGYNTAMVLSRDMVIGCTLAQGRLTAALAAQNIVVKLAVAGTNLLKAAYYLLSLQFSAAAASARAFGVALASTGVGAFIVALGAAASYMVHLANKAKDAANAEKKVAEIEQRMTVVSEERRQKVEELLKKLRDEKTAYDEKKKALEELKRIAPGYHATITEEGKLIRENGDAYFYLNKEMKKNSILEMITTRNEMMKRYKQMQKGWEKSILGQFIDENYPMKKLMEGIREMDEQIKKAEQEYWGMGDPGSGSGNVGDGGLDVGSGGTGEKDTEKQKRIRKALEKIDAEYNKRAAELKQQYIDGEIKTEQEYSTRLQQIELGRLKEKMKVAGLDEKQQSDFLQRMMDMELNVRKRIDEMTKTSAKDTAENRLKALDIEYEASKKYIEDAYQNGIIPTEERYKEYLLALENNYNLKKKELLEKKADEELAKLDTAYNDELSALQMQKEQMLLTEEEYEMAVLDLRRKYAEKKEEIENKSKETEKRIKKEETNLTLEEERKRNEKLVALKEEYRGVIEQYATQFGEDLANIVTDTNSAFKKMSKDFLLMALDMVEKYIEVNYVGTLSGDILKGGWAGFATAAAKIAAVRVAFGIAKGLVEAYDTGGFTPNGAWDQPQGIVHSNEFVANRHAVRNPQVLPVLQLIDAAQRTGSIANLTGQQIASVATGSAPASPSMQPAHNHITQSARDPELTAAIHLLVRMATKATEAYKKPVRAYTFADGRGGVNEAQALLDKMLNNASRKS